MNSAEVVASITKSYQDIVVKKAYGETTFFYNKNLILPHGAYFLTIKEQDGPNDKQSCLYRDSVYRLSWCIGRKKYQEIFGDVPKRKKKNDLNLDADFSKINKLLPHPIYSWMSWVMLLSPDQKTFQKYSALIDISYQQAVEKFQHRMRSN